MIKFKNSKMILLDGGVGGEIDKQLKITCNKKSWCATHHETHKDVVFGVHLEFNKNGAQIATANTFSILQYILKYSNEQIEDSVKIKYSIKGVHNE